MSLFTDLASEMVYPLNPIFLTKVLGAPAWTVGLVEGVAETTASLLKLFSGGWSDWVGRRKPFAIAGYGLAAISKPLTAVATHWGHVFAARFLDRVGKGLRAAPRDALIVENCTPQQRGRAFGLHRSMDTMGALFGPLLGYALLLEFPGQFRLLYALAFFPALLGMLVLIFFVRERTKPRTETLSSERKGSGVALPSWRGLSPRYRRYLVIVALFSLGNSSDAFLILRAQSVGVKAEHVLLLYALFNSVEATFGYLAGRLSDRLGRLPLLSAGYLVFAVVYLSFARLSSIWPLWLLFPAYGIYSTLTQGVQRAFAADLAHPERRGAEMGLFHMTVGLAALPASLIAGLLYSQLSPAAPFYLGALAAALASVALVFVGRGQTQAGQ